MKVCTSTTLNITLAEQRCYVARCLSQPQLVTSQQEMSNPWMTRQLGHRLAVLSQLPIWLQGAEPSKQIVRLRVSSCRRSIKPLKVTWLDTPFSELEGQAREIRLLDFWRTEARHLVMLRFRPESIAHTRLDPPCSTSTLSCTGF